MSQTGVVSWSQTSANNATADAAVNYAEGQAPSSLNDSARAAMASVAKYRDDIAGAIVTSGTSTAYTLTSFQQFSSLSVLAGQMIAFTPHTTCGGTVTLNVDSLGAKPLRSAPGIEIPAGTIVQGSPYLAVYNNSDGAFYLQSFYGNQTFSTGDLKPTLKTVADAGWVMGGANATIGNAGSGANFASVTALALYTLIWNNVSSPTANAFCAVTGGLGASAAADWAGLKPLSTGWWSGHALGLAGSGGSLTTRVLGSDVHSETTTLAAGNIPSLTSSGSNNITVTLPSNTIPVTVGAGSAIPVTNGGGSNLVPDNGSGWGYISSIGPTANNISVTYSNTSPTGASVIQPTIWVNVMIKL